ncbi:MAG: 5-oxoprolinase subunit PxpB [Sphingobacteriales bacterium]|nr:5-oxoprolinase subunit PxpB [Sphingobacteriales bacterium]
MNHPVLPYRIFPLGDSAITVDFGNCISEVINDEVIARFYQIQNNPLPGIIEVVPAYSSITVYYDVLRIKKKTPAEETAYDCVKQQLENLLRLSTEQRNNEKRLMKIPVCYDSEFATDIKQMAAVKKLSPDEIINIHTSKAYRVYMLGFLPGFTYMGEVDERITMPRKPQPVIITAGSVGIAGRQTGIYPLASPGGWQIIGRTPLRLTSLNPSEGGTSDDPENLTLLKAGDTVQFYSISRDEFENY